MAGQFEKLTINQELTEAEITAIDALKDVKIDDLKSALKTEKLAGTNESFLDMTTAFSTFNVIYKEGSTDEYSNVIGAGLVCDKNAPKRLKDIIDDKDDNDFAYFLYKVSGFLNVSVVAGLETKKIGKVTKDQLTSLKTEIEKAPAPIIPPEDNKNKPIIPPEDNKNKPITNPEINPIISPETLKPEEITFKLYSGVTQGEVLIAVEKLRKANPALANTIIPLLKSGDVKGIQKALGMKEDATQLYEKADGKFGSKTLKNLEAGKVIEQKSTYAPKTSTETKEKKEIKNALQDYTITMYGKPYIFKLNEATRDNLDYLKQTYGLFEIVFQNIKDRFDVDAEGNLSDFLLKEKFVKKIESSFVNDKWQDETALDGNKYAKIEDYISEMNLNTLVDKLSGGKVNQKEVNEKYGKIIQIKTIDDRDKLPAGGRPEKKVYTLSLSGKSYVFYGNGRAMVTTKDGKSEMKNTMEVADDVVKTLSTNPSENETPEIVPVGDISKPLNKDTYNKCTDKIEDTKISDFVNKYKAAYPGIEKCFNSTFFAASNESNPWFQIQYKKSNDDLAIGLTDKISMRECMDPKTHKFDQNKFFAKILNEMKPTMEANNTNEKNKNILNLVRGKTFSRSDLFGNKYDDDGNYDDYFEVFDDSLIKIHNDEYTYIDGDMLKFDLDDSGADKDWNKDLSLPISSITNKNGSLDAKKLTTEIAKLVEKIVIENYS